MNVPTPLADTAPAPPLAEVLRVAAHAWAAVRDGAALDRALTAALEAALDHPADHLPGHAPVRAASRAPDAALAAVPDAAAGPGPAVADRSGSPARRRAAALRRLGPAVRDVATTAVRQRGLIEALIAHLAPRAPAAPVAALLAVAIGQLRAGRSAPHTVVDQAVAAARAMPETARAAGFVNAVLRNVLRGGEPLCAALRADPVARCNAPAWWIERVRAAHPDQAAAIFAVQSHPPPLVLRVNRRRATVAEVLAEFARAGLQGQPLGGWAIQLATPRPVDRIPGFAEGRVSVQDAGAQLAAAWLDVRAGQRVLDACAAPGGKTGHLAESADGLHLDALDSDGARAARIEANLTRLGSRAHATVRVLVGDAAAPATWPQPPPAGGYDRILLDAPCTASGIVRRHPDIPWTRRPSDVAELATQQARLLDALWPLLKPAGRLLYVVCSLFPEEGEQQADAFLQRHADARAAALPGFGPARAQLLPADGAPAIAGLPGVHDGFFYALFEKALEADRDGLADAQRGR